MNKTTNCKNLVEWLDWVIVLCKAGDKPYIPNYSELNMFCKNENHAQCQYMRKSNALINSELFAKTINNEAVFTGEKIKFH